MKTSHLLTFVLSLVISYSISADETITSLINEEKFFEAETLLRKKITVEKYSPNLHFQLARVLSWQKKYFSALSEYDDLINKHPKNPDYKFGKAQTLYWSGKKQAAITLLETTRISSPLYIDVWQLLASILRQSEAINDSIKYQSLKQKAKSILPKVIWEKIFPNLKPAKTNSYTEVELAYNIDTLDNGSNDWSTFNLSAEHQLDNKHKVYGLITQTERYNLNDSEFLFGYYLPTNERWSLILESSFSPQHILLPRYSSFIQVQRLLPQGWNGAIGIKNKKYNETKTLTLNLSFETYWNSYRFGYSLFNTLVQANTIGDEITPYHSVSSDYFYGNKDSIGIILTSGRELEYNGTSTSPIRNINAISIKGQHWFKPKWAISYDFNSHEQGKSYTRHGYRLGLRHHY